MPSLRTTSLKAILQSLNRGTFHQAIRVACLVLLPKIASVEGFVAAAERKPRQHSKRGLVMSLEVASSKSWGVVESLPPSDGGHKLSRIFLAPDETFPNNPQHPVMIFHKAFSEGTTEQGKQLITKQKHWTHPWVWGIFEFHHYHSTAWELLVCVQGSALVQLGGPQGPTLTVEQSDSLLIPPGVAHKQLETQNGFALLGSYPTEGSSGPVDTLRSAPTPQQRQHIRDCQPPTTEPILGLELSQFYADL